MLRFGVLLIPLWLLARSNPFVPLEEPSHLSHSRAIPPAQLGEQNLSLPATARILKSVTLTHQDSDGSINQIDSRVERLIDHNAPVVIGQPTARKFPRQMGVYRPIEAFEGYGPMQLFVAEDLLKIQTRYELERSYFLPQPSRIVMDFTNPNPVSPLVSSLESDFFSQIEVQPHGGFFRLIVTLRSHHPFTIEAGKEGYLLGLN